MSTTQKNKKSLLRNLIWAGIIVTTLGLILTIVDAAVNIPSAKIGVWNPKDLWYPTGFWANIWNQLSTFTVQTNILTLIFFILALINNINKNKLTTINNGWFKFAITIYISITLIIFWAALFKPLIDATDFSKSIDVMVFLNTFLLHLFTPGIMIIYFFITAGTKKWAMKPTLTKALPVIISYMFIYLTYALIKGTFVGQIKTNEWGLREVDYSYPYFFLNVKDNLGTFFLYFFIILLLFFGLFACYYYYNNWKYDRNHAKGIKTQEQATKTINK